jgi:hypothetical protein
LFDSLLLGVPIRRQSGTLLEPKQRSRPSARQLKPASALRISGATKSPATKASLDDQSSAGFGGKSPPTMPLIPSDAAG